MIEGTVNAARVGGVSNSAEVREYPTRIAAFTPDAAATSIALKKFLHDKMYASRALMEGRERSMAMIGELFQYFLDDHTRLPLSYAEQASTQFAPRVVCDYIAGMTDVFFLRAYEQLIGPR